MSQEVRKIFDEYEKIAKLYRKDDLKEVFLNNTNGLKISIPLSLLASPFKEKELCEEVADPDAELLSELRRKMDK